MKLFQNKLFLFTLLLVVAALVIMLVAFFGGGQNTPLGRAIGAVVTPLEDGLSAITDWFGGFFGYFYRYDALEAENAALRAEVSRYRDLELHYWEAVNENTELRRLNNLRQRHADFELEMCSVISYDGSGSQSTITINRGSVHGIEENDPVVVSADGTGTVLDAIVGYVTNVGPNYANVATLLHQTANVNAMIPRSRELGVVQGDFLLSEQGKLKLSYLPNNADVEPGDWVVSTGGESYPQGLILGRVVEFKLENHGASSYAVVEPVVDLQGLSGVFVVKEFEAVD